MSRHVRRQSLSEIGFGKLETYIKLDKLGEVRIVFKNDFLRTTFLEYSFMGTVSNSDDGLTHDNREPTLPYSKGEVVSRII